MRVDITSMREWLRHWGEGPSWADPRGGMVPVAKSTLTALLAELERLRLLEGETDAWQAADGDDDSATPALIIAIRDNQLGRAKEQP